MDTVVFGDFTVFQLVIATGLILALFFGWPVLKRIFKKEKAAPHTQPVECFCGWKGRVSIHAGKCPKCGSPLGDQRAKSYR